MVAGDRWIHPGHERGRTATFLSSALIAGVVFQPVPAWADALSGSPMTRKAGAYPADLLWTVIAAILVFFMQAGFALVEAGFARAKNAVNILMKNLVDFAVGALGFWAVGFGLMFGVSNGFFGTSHFFVGAERAEAATYAFLLFQSVFCCTAATIVSGAIAERTRFASYAAFSVVMSVAIYPIFGSWAWGGHFAGGGFLERPEGGLLAQLGLPPFIDFAGSTVVHSVGGWAALAGSMAVGPRNGKFSAEGKVQPLLGHNIPLAALGVFILWLGWFGFNGGSTGGVTGGDKDLFGGVGEAFALIAVNTNLAACAGVIGAMLMSRWIVGKPDIGLSLSGAVAGLVAITAGCATTKPLFAVVIGASAGVLVVGAVRFFDSICVDDPVGAVSVHGVCGVWGTLAAAFFHQGGFIWAQFATQAIGVATAFIWAFGTSFVAFRIIHLVGGLRVSEQDELDGLDLAEHGAEAYPAEWFPAHDNAGDPASEYGGSVTGEPLR